MLEAAMSPRVQKLLKVTLTLLLLALVLPRIDYRALGRAFGALSLLEVSALVVLACLQQALLTKRFATVLTYFGGVDHEGKPLRLRDLIIDQQVGNAYGAVLPSTVGGDVIRGIRAKSRMAGAFATRSGVTWGAILLDRLVGLLALVLVPLAGLLLGAGPDSNTLLRTAAAITIVLLPLVVFAGRLFVVVAALTRERSERIHKLAAELGQVLQAATWSVYLRALCWSLLYQLSVNLYFMIAANAFDVPFAAAFPGIWIGIPLAFVLTTLPVTIGGLGLRESLFVGILGLYGIHPAQALALSIMWVAQNLASVAAGLLALWFERAEVSSAAAE